MITSLNKLRKERKFFNIILKIYKKLTTNITVNSEKLECSKTGNKERMSLLITHLLIFSIILKSPISDKKRKQKTYRFKRKKITIFVCR